MPTSLSPYPNLEQLRKQAKDLRKAHGSGAPEAAARLQAYVARFSECEIEPILEAELALRDAQHVIAREHGFGSWQDLLAAVRQQPPEPRQLLVEAVSYTEDELLPVELLQVEILARPDGSSTACVILRSADDRILPMTIGAPEGLSLASCLKQEIFPRPLTHDLFTACVEALQGEVTAVVIHAIEETTYLAHVILQVAGQRKIIDARPSDSLNLAARRRAPIYATPSLMERAGRHISELAAIVEAMTRG
ncbi:MAG: bifunctional nuclease family protein [Candidatus Latescibacteria bacterium]|nr:bifunctional nuclease family protein [Candidatus Latescibacterota bacterium]MDP7448694.1 bifunctional nuclease family protein [Candidatus Latescibacterota bacterium]HJP32367.1 bifunctional nuclease family protein [Candidatus Latescibacterota bacterium]